jgi:hypothetical protein
VSDHFCDLVKQGARPGCSSGERAAGRLAVAVCENFWLLDSEARAGFRRFVDRNETATETITCWLEDLGYDVE